MAGSAYPDPKLIEASKNVVNVVQHNETAHGEREIPMGKEKVKVCTVYGTIPCSAHTGNGNAVGKFVNGSFGVPLTIFCDPTGKELFRKTGAMGGGEVAKQMQEALAKVPGEHAPLSAWQQAKKDIAEGDAAFEKGDLKKAVECYGKPAKFRIKALKELSEKSLAPVIAKIEQMLKDALALENVEEKKKALKKIADDFKPLEVAAKAKKELDSLK